MFDIDQSHVIATFIVSLWAYDSSPAPQGSLAIDLESKAKEKTQKSNCIQFHICLFEMYYLTIPIRLEIGFVPNAPSKSSKFFVAHKYPSIFGFMLVHIMFMFLF